MLLGRTRHNRAIGRDTDKPGLALSQIDRREGLLLMHFDVAFADHAFGIGGGDFGGGDYGAGDFGGGGSSRPQQRPQPAAFDTDLDDDVPF